MSQTFRRYYTGKINNNYPDKSNICGYLLQVSTFFGINTAYKFNNGIFIGNIYLMLPALRNAFSNVHPGNAVRAAALAVSLAFGAVAAPANDVNAGELTPGQRGLVAAPANDAEAGERPSHMMRDMRHYSEDPTERGIGAFINLQANAPVTGDQIGQWIQAQFDGIEDPVPVDYRVNQSRGTTTDITFYVRGVDYELNIEELQTRLIEILNSHRGAWLPETTAALNQPAASQQ